MKNKNIFRVIALCVIATAMFCACGSSQKTVTPGGTTKGTTPTPDGLDLGSNECIDLAEQSPVVRAWGNAKHWDLSDAVNFAEDDARGKMAAAISTKIIRASEKSGFDIYKHIQSDTSGNTVSDGGTQRNKNLRTLTDGVIENTVVIKTKRFMLPNRNYNVYVTIEFQGGVSAMSKTIENKLEQQISDEDKLKLQYEFKKFKDAINEELSKTK